MQGCITVRFNQKTIAIKIKRTLSPTISKGFRLGCAEINSDKKFFILPRGEAYPLDKQTIALGLSEFLQQKLN